MPRTAAAGTLAVTALAPLAWGSTYAVTTQLLPPDRPLLAATLRALPAGLLLLLATRRLPHGSWWWRAAVLGALNIGVFFALLFLAAYRLPGGIAAVLGAVQPLLTAALAIPLLGQLPSGRALLGGVTGLFGVALVVLQATARLDAVGVLAGLGGAACMATGTVLAKRWGRPEGVGALAFTGWQLTAGGLLLLPVALAVEGTIPALGGSALVGYAYLATANTALAYWLWFRGIAKLDAPSVAFLGLLSPLAAAVIGWALLDQRLTPVQLTGMALALAGTLLGALAGPRAVVPKGSRPGRMAPCPSPSAIPQPSSPSSAKAAVAGH